MIVQKELQTCVQEVDKTKKLYFDEEHSAHDVRDKAKDIEEKYVREKPLLVCRIAILSPSLFCINACANVIYALYL